MKRTMLVMAMVMAMAMSTVGAAFAADVTPSTNDDNRENGWSHFNVVEKRPGEVDIEFNQPRSFAACFEYRVDGEETTDPRDNFNVDIEDGLWPFVCLGDAYETHSEVKTFEAEEYVEIRLVFGAERSERFDWTRVDVEAAPTVDDCKDGGFADMGFRNQGQCIASFRANENANK